MATGNLAPGNTLQNVANLLRPALLIGFLVAIRRAEASPQSEAGTVEFERWRKLLLQASVPLTMAIATAYGVGFAVDQPILVTLVGLLVAAALLAFVLFRSPWRGEQQDQGTSGAA